jgi:hypothetical protein
MGVERPGTWAERVGGRKRSGEFPNALSDKFPCWPLCVNQIQKMRCAMELDCGRGNLSARPAELLACVRLASGVATPESLRVRDRIPHREERRWKLSVKSSSISGA